MDETEQRRDGEEVVLDYVKLVDEVQHFGLCATAAVYHTVDFWAIFVENATYDWSVGAGRREDHLAGIDAVDFGGVGEAFATAIYHFVGQVVVEAFGELLGVVFRKNVVACRGQAVAAHTAVIFGLVGGFAVGGKAYDDVAGTDMGVVDYIGAVHTGRDGAVDDDGAYQVAHVGCLAAGQGDAYAEVAHLLQELFGAVDDSADNLARNKALVAANGAAEQDVVDCAHA